MNLFILRSLIKESRFVFYWGVRCVNRLPDPACRPGITPPHTQSMSLYGHAACTVVEKWLKGPSENLWGREGAQKGNEKPQKGP